MQKEAFTHLAPLLTQIKKTGLFDPFALPFSARFTRNLKIYYHSGSHAGFFVKACPGNGAQREYQALQFAHEKTDGHVPEPLHLSAVQQLSAYVSPLYRFAPLTARHVIAKPFVDQICSILRLGVVPDNNSPQMDKDVITPPELELFATEQQIVDKTNQQCMAYLNHSHDLLQKVGCIPQHGDATPYNFSVDHNKIYLCDWEDFGIITFPGFDLATCIFEISRLLHLQTDLAHSPEGVNKPELLKIIAPVLTAGVLSVKQWQALFPFYMLLFSYVKKNLGYHSDYVRKVSCFTKTMFHSEKWQDCFLGCRT